MRHRWDSVVLVVCFLPFVPGFIRECRQAVRGWRRFPY